MYLREYSGWGYSIRLSPEEDKVYFMIRGLKEPVDEGADIVILSGEGRVDISAILKLLSNGKLIVLKLTKRSSQVIYPRPMLHIHAVRAQHAHATSPEMRSKIALTLLRSASLNKLFLLKTLGLRRDLYVKFKERTLRLLDEMRRASPEKYMGYEAQISKEYYDNIRMLLPEEYEFEARTRMPPRDPVSAALSYFNVTLLYPLCEQALSVAGLDPRISFLHEIRGTRPSLALDLAEQFRQPLVDLTVFAAFMNRLLNPKRDFVHRGEAVYLGSRGKKKLWRLLLSKLRLKVPWTNVTLRESILLEAVKLREYLLGHLSSYEGFHPPLRYL